MQHATHVSSSSDLAEPVERRMKRRVSAPVSAFRAFPEKVQSSFSLDNASTQRAKHGTAL